jgi:hypothetical protein
LKLDDALALLPADDAALLALDLTGVTKGLAGNPQAQALRNLIDDVRYGFTSAEELN